MMTAVREELLRMKLAAAERELAKMEATSASRGLAARCSAAGHAQGLKEEIERLKKLLGERAGRPGN